MTALFGVRDLAALRVAAQARVDAAAEAARLKYITPGAGQAAVYLLKRDEARRFLELAPLGEVPAEWPMLAAELGVTGDTLRDVAVTVSTLAQEWTTIAAEIETIRLATKAAIDAAGSPAAISRLADRVTYPEPEDGR